MFKEGKFGVKSYAKYIRVFFSGDGELVESEGEVKVIFDGVGGKREHVDFSGEIFSRFCAAHVSIWGR